MALFTGPIPYPDSVGARHSFVSLKAIVAGVPILGLKKCSYSRTRTREIMHGTHSDPIGKTQGENAYKASLDLYLAEFQQLKSALIVQAALLENTGYGDVFFSIQAQYFAAGFAVIQDEIQGCTLDETGAEQSQGPAALIRGIDLNPLKILFDGDDDVQPQLVRVAEAGFASGIASSLGPGF
jgi:hypothetical protein